MKLLDLAYYDLDIDAYRVATVKVFNDKYFLNDTKTPKKKILKFAKTTLELIEKDRDIHSQNPNRLEIDLESCIDKLKAFIKNLEGGQQ